MTETESATLDRILDTADGTLTNRVPLADAVEHLQTRFALTPLHGEWETAMAHACREVAVDLIERRQREPDSLGGIERRLADLLTDEARKLRLVNVVGKMLVPAPCISTIVAEHFDEAHAEADTAEKPRYTHDCDKCVFLGQHHEYDLYFCTQGGTRPTVVARYGDEGSHYTSGIGFYCPNGALLEAEDRSRAKGLLPPRVDEEPDPFDVDAQHGTSGRREV